jgi:integrase
VKIRGALQDVLLELRGRHQDTEQSAYVFGTSRGGQQSPDNFRSRVLRAAIDRANENLTADGLPPLPERITPHSLRRTFCSLLYALGEDPGVVMDEMGHTNPALALRVYRQAMRRGDDEKAQLRALVEGSQLAVIDSAAMQQAAA